MSDTRTLVLSIVGTGVGLAVLLTGVMYALIGGVNGRIDGVNGRIDGVNDRIDNLRVDLRDLRADMREDHARFDTRLDAVEVELGKVDQRLLTIERVVLPGPDADE